MIIELQDSTSAKISSAIVKARRSVGSPASGLVMTMIVPVDESRYEDALSDSLTAGREHPSRIVLVVTGRGRRNRLDAEIRLGEEMPGEVIVLRVAGEVAKHADSVVLPLLLPDSPVVVWWPGVGPENPIKDPLGALATRRITDAMSAPRPLTALTARAHNQTAGDTDLTWTRLTRWRVLLAASLDQYPAPINAVTVEAASDNAPAHLLAAWLENRLKVQVRRLNSKGPGITAVRMTTPAGDIAITRDDGVLASYLVPGQPQRRVALRRREVNQLLTEELRRMDPDDVFEATSQMLVRREGRRTAARRAQQAPARKASADGPAARTTKKAGAKKASAKKADAKQASAQQEGVAKSAVKAAARKPTTNRTTTRKTPAEAPAARGAAG